MQAVTLGPAGTYSHRAARAVADDVAFRESVTAIVESVRAGEFDRGVVPVENSIEGSVTESLDALADGVAVSHSQALAQCREFLEREYPDQRREAVASTARGVARARDDESVAAIGHPANATGGDPELTVLAEEIQDRSSNATRFLVVGPEAERSEAGGKTSVVVYPAANYPGLLLELLEAFADRDINLSRVESRPSGRRLGDYLFHVDFEAGLYEDRTSEALDTLRGMVAEEGWVRVRHSTHCAGWSPRKGGCASSARTTRNTSWSGWVRVLGSYDTEHVVE
jgi:prephenate dehydratase